MFNLTYHPAFSKVKNILQDIHLLLMPNQEHRDVFAAPPIVGFRRGKNLKDMLVRAKLPVKEKVCGGSQKCGSKRCGVCDYVEETDSFTNRSSSSSFKIQGKKKNCNSNNVVYLAQCRKCGVQYVGSTSTKFRVCFNNYKCSHWKFSLGKPVIQLSFHSHFEQPDHNGMEDWSFTLIDHAESLSRLRRKESFWQHKLDSFQPNGLNEREVTLDY